MSNYMVRLVSAAVLAGALAARGDWYDNMKIKGDVRYRVEHIDEEGKDPQQRDRIRVRLGVFPRLGPDADAGIQIATGEAKSDRENPTSSNATLTDEFGGKSLWLDLGYLTLHPTQLKGLELIGGKMRNPFLCVGDYLWDSDVNPEGAALKYTLGAGDHLDLLANASYFWVLERSGEDDDNKMYGVQGALRVKPTSDVYILPGCSYYQYEDIKGINVVDLNWKGEAKAYGNTTTKVVTGGRTNFFYANDYAVVEPFVEAGFSLRKIPFTLFGSYAVNVEADEDNQGYMAGLAVGKLGDRNTYQVAYNYRRLEKDATLGVFADSDSWGGGTDGQGHKISASYMVFKNVSAGASYFINDKKLEDSIAYERLQVDVVGRF